MRSTHIRSLRKNNVVPKPQQPALHGRQPRLDREVPLPSNSHKTANIPLTSPAEAVAPPEEEKEANDTLYEERIDRYISDDVPTTPLIDESNAENGTGERIKAQLNAFEEAFDKKVEKDEESDKKKDDGGEGMTC